MLKFNILKRNIALIGVFTLSYTVFAQKVDLDKKQLNVNYTVLPSKPIFKDFTSQITSVLTSPNALNVLKTNEKELHVYGQIEGFKKTSEDWDFAVEISIGDLNVISSNLGSRMENMTNNDGNKVVKVYYFAQVSYRMPTTYKVTQANGERVAFYEAGTTQKPYIYRGSEYASPGEAERQLSDAVSKIAGDARYQVPQFLRSSQADVNQKHGYLSEANNKEAYLWILDSKEHPDYPGYAAAVANTVTAFDSMKSAQPLANCIKLAAPALEYWTKKKNEIVVDGKKAKKLKYGCLFNLSMVYLWLEDFEKAKANAQELITNDFDEKDGKELLIKIEAVKQLLAQAKETSRHFARNLERTKAPTPITYKLDTYKAAPKGPAFKEATKPPSITVSVRKGRFVRDNGTVEEWPVWVDIDKNPQICFGANNNVTVVSWSKDSVVSKSNIVPRSYTSFSINGQKFITLPYDPSTLIGGERPNPELFREIRAGASLGLYMYMPSGPEGLCVEGVYVLYLKGATSAITAKDVFGTRKKKILAYLKAKELLCEKIESGEQAIETEEDFIDLVNAYNRK